MRRVVTALFVVTLVLVPAATASAQRPVEAVTYRPPVVAPVIDGFRPPSTPYGPGNHGLEYATTPGTAVRSAAAGTATFAGQVGGQLHVTLLHADGLRTTYAFLATVAVRAGQAVGAAEVVGLAGPRLVWTARLGDAYVDPAVLLAASGVPSVRLVPLSRSRAGTAPSSRPVPAAAVRWALEGGSGGRMLADRPGDRLVDTTHTPTRVTPRSRSTPGWVVPGPGLATDGKGGADGPRRDHEAAPGGRRPLRPPDPALEPQDEAVHLR